MFDLELTSNPAVACWNRDAMNEGIPAPSTEATLGKIVCDGCTENPAVGYICTARVETPVSIDGPRQDFGTQPDIPNFRLVQPLAAAA